MREISQPAKTETIRKFRYETHIINAVEEYLKAEGIIDYTTNRTTEK